MKRAKFEPQGSIFINHRKTSQKKICVCSTIMIHMRYIYSLTARGMCFFDNVYYILERGDMLIL